MVNCSLLFAVVACTLATVAADCYQLTRNKESYTTYSANRNSDGKYPSGSGATMNCPNSERSATYWCNGDHWQGIILSFSCGRDCTFENVKGLHYSAVVVNGEPTREATIPHQSSAELLCGEQGGGAERHKYRCFDGGLHKDGRGKTCNNCAVELATKLGFKNMQSATSNGLYYGDAVHGDLVLMQCGGRVEYYRCANSQFVPNRYDRDPFVMCGCPPIKEPKSFVKEFKISTSPVRGVYKQGTTATLSCVNGPVQGAAHIKCENGNWDKPLGICPRCPSLEKPTTYEKYSYTTDSLEDGGYSNGTEVTLSCTSGPVLGDSTSTCEGDKWEPDLGRCPYKCDGDALIKERKFTAYLLDVIGANNGRMLNHLLTAAATCSPNGLRGFDDYTVLTCNDGKWEPENERCDA